MYKKDLLHHDAGSKKGSDGVPAGGGTRLAPLRGPFLGLCSRVHLPAPLREKKAENSLKGPSPSTLARSPVLGLDAKRPPAIAEGLEAERTTLVAVVQNVLKECKSS